MPPSWFSGLLSAAIAHPAYAFAAVTAVTVVWGVHTQRGIAQLPIVTGLMHVMGGWAAALGASVSRRIRRKHPTFGDEAGAWVARSAATIFVVVSMFALGGLFSLHTAWPQWLTLDAIITLLLGILPG